MRGPSPGAAAGDGMDPRSDCAGRGAPGDDSDKEVTGLMRGANDGHRAVVGCGGESSWGGPAGSFPRSPSCDYLAAALVAARLHAFALAETRPSTSALVMSRLYLALAALAFVGESIGAAPCWYLLTWHR